uniref:Uncharacterized protein n=1 Tax=Romanomermis culicivorax TaxID=13658 RepID=A0A915JRY7_ROMCU
PHCGPPKKVAPKTTGTGLLTAREPEKSSRSESSSENKPSQLHDLPMVEQTNPTKKIDKAAAEKLNISATPLTDVQSEPVKAFPRLSQHVAIDDKSSRSESSNSNAFSTSTKVKKSFVVNQKKNVSSDQSSSEKSTSSSKDMRHKMAAFLTKTLSKISSAVGSSKVAVKKTAAGGSSVFTKTKDASKIQNVKKASRSILKKAKN